MEPELDVDRPPLQVVAGILLDRDGRVLLAQRPAGKAFAGRWEFPGGKQEPGETRRHALERELREELGIEVLEATPFLLVGHRYPGAPVAVHIDSWRVTRWSGTPASLDGQALRWCEPRELPDVDILEADRPIVTALRLPSWIVRDALEAPCGTEVLCVGCDDGAAVLDPVEAPGDALVIWTSTARLQAARGPRALSGCVVQDAADAAIAKSRGADFLLVPQDPGAGELERISALGLPWYLEADIEAPLTAPVTGRLRWT